MIILLYTCDIEELYWKKLKTCTGSTGTVQKLSVVLTAYLNNINA